MCVVWSYYRFEVFLFWCFFFQAEDGIRDIGVTGVQTCALPVCNEFGISPSTDFRFHQGMNEGLGNVYIDYSNLG